MKVMFGIRWQKKLDQVWSARCYIFFKVLV